MDLVKFPEHNVVYAEHQPPYLPLPAYRFDDDPEGRIICCWRLSWRERIRLLFTGRVWHHVLTFNRPLQPQMLDVESPFISS